MPSTVAVNPFDHPAHDGSWVLWLSHHSTWEIAAIVIGGGLLLSVGAVLLANNYFTREQLIANNQVGSFKFMFVAELFAGILAFLLVGFGDRYANAQAFIHDEAAAWRSLVTVVEAFPSDVPDRLEAAISRYAESVVRTEWPAMELGEESPVSQRLFTDILDIYFAIEPRDIGEQSLLMLGNQFVDQANQARTNRMNNNLNDAVANLIWFTLACVIVFTVAFNSFFGSLDLQGQLLMTAALSIGLLSNVLLALLLGNPFSGETAVSPAPFLALIR